MSIMIIDVETNGFMDYSKSAEDPSQPRVVEFAGVTLDDDLGVTGTFQAYIQRDGWSMTPESTAANGITDDLLDRQGIPISNVLDWYTHKILAGHDVVTFNAQFDCKFMRSELARAGRHKLFRETHNACLMRDAKPFAKSLGRVILKHGKKLDGTPVSQSGWPSLSDLCDFLGVVQVRRHNALDDVMSTLACLREMVVMGYEPDPQVHESKNLEAIKSGVEL